jgi:Protein of unknown function (DUF3135)
MDALPLRENPDHEFLSRLARDDPESFERLRKDLIDQLIGRAPDPLRQRLAGLQFRVDQVRRLARTPLGATVKVSSMMWSSFLRLNDGLTGRRPLDTIRPASPGGRVIAFRRPADRIE